MDIKPIIVRCDHCAFARVTYTSAGAAIWTDYHETKSPTHVAYIVGEAGEADNRANGTFQLHTPVQFSLDL